MAATIKFKRGASDNVSLAAGEPAFNTSASKFFIGTNGTNKTWVGAEIEPTATVDWTDPSDSKLATQLAIQNYVLGEGSINAKVQNTTIGTDTFYPMFISHLADIGRQDGGTAQIQRIDTESFSFIPVTNTLRVGPIIMNAVGAGESSVMSNVTNLHFGIADSVTSNPCSINIGNKAMSGSDPFTGTMTVNIATNNDDATANFVFGSNNQTNGSFTSRHNVIIAREKSLRFNDVDNNAYVGFKAPSVVPTSYTLILPDTLPNMGEKGGTPKKPLVSDASGNLSWGEFNSETTTFNIADSSDNSAELNLVMTEFNSDTAGQGSALIDTAAGTSGQDGGIKYNPSTNTLTTSVFRVREGTTAAYISIDAPTGTTSYSFTLPTTGGTPNYVLKTDGSGNTSWTEVIEKANKVHVTDTPGTVGLNGFEAVYYPSFYEDSSSQSTNFYATRVDEKAYEVKPTRNRFTLKTGELPVGISRWTTCSTGAGNCQSGILPPPDVGGTGVDPGTTDSSGGGGTTDSSGGGGTTDSSGGGVTPGETGFDTPSSEDVGNFGVGELEFSARNLSTDVETGYLRFSINPALTQHISYVLPDTLPTPGQFLAVGETNFEKDSDLGDVRQLTWTTSAGQVNVADASEDSQYNAAYALTFAATTGGAGKGLLYDTHDNNSVGGLTWNPKTNVLRAGAIEFNTGILEDDANQGGTSYNTIDLGAVGASSQASDVNLFVQSTGIITIGDTAGAEVRVPTINAASNANAAATKAYVDAVAEGLHVHASAKYATTVNVAGTYSNGTNNDGIGATITATSSGQLVVDANNVVLQDRILVKNQSNSAHNGIYVVTNTGAAGNYQLTRAEDFNTSAEVDGGDFVFVTDGATQNKTGWVQTTRNVTIGSTSIVFSQFAGVGTYTAGNGVRIDGTVFGLTNSNNTGFLTLNNNGAIYSNGTGLVSGTLPVAAGGTNISSYATGDILYATGVTTLSKLAKPSTAGNYLLQMDENGTPSWQNRTGLSIENAEKVKVTTTESSGTYYLTYTTSATNNSYESVLESAKLTYNPSTTYIGQNNVAVLTVDGYVDAIIDGGTYN